MNVLKNFLKTLPLILTNILFKFKAGRFFMQFVIESTMRQTFKVENKNIKIFFQTPNWLNRYRAETFFTKEPETLEWLDNMIENSIFWDIGANVGLYSIYAAKMKNCRVYSFEPSVFNLELLARNIFINQLHHKITIIPIALSNTLSENIFKMSSTQWGGALSTFGLNIDQNGNDFNQIFEYKTIGLTMNQAVSLLNITPPDFIKIDVDGIEHFILMGGDSILQNVKGVLIEINDEFSEQSSISSKLLKKAGLSLYKKCIEGVDSELKQYNQWWTRDNV